MAEGVVEWFSPDKGFGFISSGDGEDVFVHFSQITGDGYRNLEKGQKVEFEIGPGKDGKLQANNVRVVG